MKTAFVTAFAALAASAVAAPASNNNGPISNLLPSGGGSNVASKLPSNLASKLPSNLASNITSNLPTLGKGGHLVEGLTPKVNEVLTVLDQDLQPVFIKLSAEVTAQLSGLRLPQVGNPVGQIVHKASSVGELVKNHDELVKNLGVPAEHLLTVISQNGSALLVKLSPTVAGLVSGVGLPQVGNPVGLVVNTIGQSVNGEVLTVLGQDLQPLLIKVSAEATVLLSGLRLPLVGNPVGQIVRKAGSVDELVKNLGELVKCLGHPVEELLVITGKDGGALLVKLAPAVASSLSGLGLPTVGTTVGAVVHIVGNGL
ncbi:hypothetical protein PHISP_06840 [Aspergillus sp. HF37]|nr:hypothetical protein PHISP_06840 [Aspergillus sp. HF37]